MFPETLLCTFLQIVELFPKRYMGHPYRLAVCKQDKLKNKFIQSQLTSSINDLTFERISLMAVNKRWG